MLEQIASAKGQNDEIPNIELAEKLAKTQDKAGIDEIVSGLAMEKKIANDCIKVLYEIGQRAPALITPYAEVFAGLLKAKENRLVWGAMTALSQITELVPEAVFAHFNDVYAAYEKGSVITVDNSISVFSLLCKTGASREQKILPILVRHLQNCRAKEIPQHLERMAVCFTVKNANQFCSVVQARYGELSKPQQARVNKTLKRIPKG